MRFRKSVKVCPGVRLNFSKSGVSTSIGVRGASVTVGKKGVYANYGVPGTGIYNRERILKWNDGTSSGGNSKNSGVRVDGGHASGSADDDEIEIRYLDDGSFEFYQGSALVSDKSLISKIKRSDEFKAQLAIMNEHRLKEYEEIDNKYTKIGEMACPIFHSSKEALIALKPQLIEPREFDGFPSEEELRKEAASKVTTLKFWEKEKRVKEKMEELRQNALLEKAEFEKAEKQRVEKANKDALARYEEICETVEKIGNGDEDAFDSVVSSWVETLDFPFEFNLDYQLRGKKLFVDLDLPEMEDMPNKKAVKMASGVVKIKDKSQKDIRQDYEDCVFGLTIFFASYLFNMAVGCDEIVLSEYTQRRDKEGRLKDVYTLSVKFVREKFENLGNFITAKQQCMKFENACNQSSTGVFKEVNPYPGDID